MVNARGAGSASVAVGARGIEPEAEINAHVAKINELSALNTAFSHRTELMAARPFGDRNQTGQQTLPVAKGFPDKPK